MTFMSIYTYNIQKLALIFINFILIKKNKCTKDVKTDPNPHMYIINTKQSSSFLHPLLLLLLLLTKKKIVKKQMGSGRILYSMMMMVVVVVCHGMWGVHGMSYWNVPFKPTRIDMMFFFKEPYPGAKECARNCARHLEEVNFCCNRIYYHIFSSSYIDIQCCRHMVDNGERCNDCINVGIMAHY